MRLLYDKPCARSLNFAPSAAGLRGRHTARARKRCSALRASSGLAASAGDSRETDNAASIQLVEPSGHKLIMDIFLLGQNSRRTTS